jgi:hypothetical protein
MKNIVLKVEDELAFIGRQVGQKCNLREGTA